MPTATEWPWREADTTGSPVSRLVLETRNKMADWRNTLMAEFRWAGPMEAAALRRFLLEERRESGEHHNGGRR